MNNKKLIILGAGGHGRVVAETAEQLGYSVSFLDDTKSDNDKVIGKISDFNKYINGYSFFVAIGNNELRKDLLTELSKSGAEIATLIHPKSAVSKNATIEKGTVVMAGAVVNSGSHIGEGCILNTSSSVDHDCNIAEFTHISVGAHLAGNVRIGEESFVCAGATVINNISICKKCIIGAGAVVIKDITESGTYIGVPAVKK